MMDYDVTDALEEAPRHHPGLESPTDSPWRKRDGGRSGPWCRGADAQQIMDDQALGARAILVTDIAARI